jgi:23S rRNA pseudouridine1911/1915/1917 synthase
MTSPPFRVLLEDNHLLVVDKPAGLPTMGVAAGTPSLLSLAKQYLKDKYQKPGNVYLGIVSRLDAPVTGLVVMARTSKAAGRLSKQFRERDVTKLYWAVIERPPYPVAGTLRDWVRKDERHRKVLVTDAQTEGAQNAQLSYRTLKHVHQAVLLEIDLLTGRKHQIRVQLGARRLPILGDRKYGSRVTFEPGIALHARSIRFAHPVRQTEIELTAGVPRSWFRLGVRE